MPQEAAKALDTQASAQASAATAAAKTTTATAASTTSSAGSSSTAGKTPQEIAHQMIPDDAQYQCFNNIVSHESGWDVTATNASSGAYGLVQALPGSKMASAGSDWQTNPATQIKWGLDYMDSTYGSPCGAWSFWQANGWY
ncbi:transglycosylase SLT domain-containing protein [Streptomyces sp. NBC_01465]|nr:transglycosylase SLT domain-containing protein [Streptomyces sp. NBC_01465]